MADKFASVSNKSLTELHLKELQNDEIEILKEKYLTPKNRQQIIDELRLV